MGIFERKFDIEKDRLRVVFNPNTMQYDTFYGKDLIPYEKLKRSSKKNINEKNQQLQIDPNILKKEMEIAQSKERFHKLSSLGFSCDSFEYLGSVNGTMSSKIEDLLNQLTSEKDVLLGIHRIGLDNSEEKIKDILINGLKMTGHGNGSVQSPKELKNNVSYYPDNKIIIKELMYANQYKNSKGSILIKIPDTDLTKEMFVIGQDGTLRLNPKYIVGYIPLEENHHLETIITVDEIKRNNSQYDYIFENNRQINYDFENRKHKTK